VVQDGTVAGEKLSTVVIAYDDVDIALSDFADLQNGAKRRGREDDYEAAVLQRKDGHEEIVASTVSPRERDTMLGAGLGLVVGALFSPALPIVIAGAGVGALIGNVMDQLNAFDHTDMTEVEGLVTDSAAALIVISDEAGIDRLVESAVGRHRRVVLPVADAHVDLLKREIQRVHPHFGD
jgi:uncharacterized membrane protein